MMAEAIAASDSEPSEELRILSADLSGAPLPSLGTDEGRAYVEGHLDGEALLILDSISTLCGGEGAENEAESWESMQNWLLDLRRAGRAVLLLHHDNKAGGQRGTSKREDVLSQVVQLRRPKDYSPTQGARFEVHLTKARGVHGPGAEPFEAQLRSGKNGEPEWSWCSLGDATKVSVLNLYCSGVTNQRTIAKELGIGLGTVNRRLKQLRNEGAIK